MPIAAKCTCGQNDYFCNGGDKCVHVNYIKLLASQNVSTTQQMKLHAIEFAIWLQNGTY